MIVTKSISLLILSICLLNPINGASFSNVYVESENSPIRYYRQEAPYSFATITSPKLAQIKNLPASGPDFITPCVAPCIIPARSVAAAPANIIAYNSQYTNVPVVIEPKEDTTGYQYSYVVHDENTGDHKAQRELSDGTVVRGEYSFLQPDGYVREVKYVADDVNGFNAVVKNFLPVTLESKVKVDARKRKEPTPPCHEVHKGSIKEALNEEMNEAYEHEVETSHETEQTEPRHEKVTHEPEHIQEDSIEIVNNQEHSSETKHDHEHSPNVEHDYDKSWEMKNSKELNSVTEHDHALKPNREHGHENSHELEHSRECNHQPAEKHSEHNEMHIAVHGYEHTHEVDHKHKPKHSHEQGSNEHSKTESNKSGSESADESFIESSEKKSKEDSAEKFTKESSKESSNESKENHVKPHQKEPTEEFNANHVENSKESSKESKEENSNPQEKSEESLKKHHKNSKKISKEESDSVSEENSSEEIVVVLEKQKGSHELVAHQRKLLVPYNDVIRCVEAAIMKTQEKPAALREEPSPLTYIILNKPC